jgi:hypothetical protein
MKPRELWRRLQQIVFHNILHLDDTPHRIAWGVFIGAMIAFTPTLGLQILLYLPIAALLRANKVSGIPILFISNPFTAVPLYYTTWSVGAAVLHPEKEVTRATIKTWLGASFGAKRAGSWPARAGSFGWAHWCAACSWRFPRTSSPAGASTPSVICGKLGGSLTVRWTGRKRKAADESAGRWWW